MPTNDTTARYSAELATAATKYPELTRTSEVLRVRARLDAQPESSRRIATAKLVREALASADRALAAKR